MAGSDWSTAGKNALTAAGHLVVPVFLEREAFGPRQWDEVALSLLLTTACCMGAGFLLTWPRAGCSRLLVRLLLWVWPLELRDEVWEEARQSGVSPCNSSESGAAAEEGDASRRRPSKKRTGAELLFISVHNSAVSTLAVLAWLLGLPSLALHAFTLEVAYEIFDTWSLGAARMEPETLIHHIVSPICILCSTQTDVDYRVLCHLCICIDVSGAVLGLAKFLLRFSHISPSLIYRRLLVVYVVLRVVLPLMDTAIIVHREVSTKGGLFSRLSSLDAAGTQLALGKTDWTQLYFWAMAVLNAFNIYFCLVIRSRARLPAQVVANYEARMSGCN